MLVNDLADSVQVYTTMTNRNMENGLSYGANSTYAGKH